MSDNKGIGGDKIVASGDQVGAILRDSFAPTLGSYYKALKVQGFTDDQAFILVRDYHDSILLRPVRDETDET